jgi:alkylation response protein AidB-like acyl-CoA dehydrogenase
VTAAIPDTAGVLVELRRWIEASWDPELSLVHWRELLADAGWACPAWPNGWCGRSLPAALAALVTEELAGAGVPGSAEGVGVGLAGPVLIEHGTDALRERFVRRTVTGEITWCQLFSEPGAGSDLAGLTTRAEAVADGWLVTGQKVWSTGAATADFGLLLARTDASVPKHRGITCFVLPMRQPGVEARPLRQMNGHASFNEVFLDQAKVPAVNLIGEQEGGWTVALSILAHERRLAASRPGPVPAGATGRAWREAIAERTAASEPHKWYPQRAGRPDLVTGQAIAHGLAGDPLVRQEIARLVELAWSARWTAERAAAARAAGRPPGPEGSLGKMASSVIARQAARVHALIAGPHGMLAGPGSPLDGTIAEIFLSVPGISIAGGTDQIQRTIIGERILGLPREPDPSRNLPFREAPDGLPGPGRRPHLLPDLRVAGRCHAAPAHPRLLGIVGDVAAEYRGARRRTAGHHLGPARSWQQRRTGGPGALLSRSLRGGHGRAARRVRDHPRGGRRAIPRRVPVAGVLPGAPGPGRRAGAVRHRPGLPSRRSAAAVERPGHRGDPGCRPRVQRRPAGPVQPAGARLPGPARSPLSTPSSDAALWDVGMRSPW